MQSSTTTTFRRHLKTFFFYFLLHTNYGMRRRSIGGALFAAVTVTVTVTEDGYTDIGQLRL